MAPGSGRGSEAMKRAFLVLVRLPGARPRPAPIQKDPTRFLQSSAVETVLAQDLRS